jgi:S1 RNA binding domain protein
MEDKTVQPVQPEVKLYASGEEVQGKVTGITSFGAFVKPPDGTEGLVHISEIANTYVTSVEQFLKLGQEIVVKVLGKNQKGKYDLSIKQVPKEKNPGIVMPSAPPPRPAFDRGGDKKKAGFEPGSFDDMMHQFLKNSDEIQLDVRRNLQYKQGLKKKGQKKRKDED